MPLSSTARDFARGYDKIDSFVFDRMFAPIVRPFHDWALARLQPLLPARGKVLDVGCGGGRFALALAERYPNLEFVGIDISSAQIERAHARAAGHERVHFVEGSADDMPFAADSFDLVYSLGCMKYWPEPDRGLRECARVLHDAGGLLLIEGDRGCRHEDVAALAEAWKVPAPLRPLAIGFYRTVVVGGSLDLVDARALLDAVPELDATVERAEGLPAWVITTR